MTERKLTIGEISFHAMLGRCRFCEMGFNSFRIHVLMQQLSKTSFNFSLKCQRNEFETQLRSKSLLMHEATDNHSELKLLIILACKL